MLIPRYYHDIVAKIFIVLQVLLKPYNVKTFNCSKLTAKTFNCSKKVLSTTKFC